ncbi:RING-type domain-containing protein [Aphelenchoides bicaudatus]|nr:RING-type domain-containing protein [Aphelenchoides bicaudatus]
MWTKCKDRFLDFAGNILCIYSSLRFLIISYRLMVPQSGCSYSTDFNSASLKRALENNDLLKCSLCLKLFEEPVVLNCCSQRYCEKCLKSYTKLNGLKCPNCEHLFGDGEYFSLDKAFSLAIQLASMSRDVEQPCTSNGVKNVDDLNKTATETYNMILWPDASVYNLNLPSCAKRPRYIQVPDTATVSHLIEFLFIRIEVEGKLETIRKEYKIELTNVLAEFENFQHCYLPDKASFLNRTSSHPTEELEEPEEFSHPNTMISIRHPFQELDFALTAQQLIEQLWIDKSRPFKLVFKFTALT